MKMTTGQKLFVLVAVLINAVLWIVPSNVVELIARDRQTLLGRYSREHFTWIMAVAIISAIGIYVHVSPNSRVKKAKAFRVAAVVLGCFLPLLLGDMYLRLTKTYIYELDGMAYHRPAGAHFEGVFKDAPEAVRSYPNAPAGYADVPWTLTADQRGYRNASNADTYDVVVLGDSFVEGSKVSDGQPWPALFDEQSDLTVYNLGMSGYAPHHSLAALMKHGLPLKPKWVVFLLYEGNDFRKANLNAKPRSKWAKLFKRSPIIESIDNVMIQTLGPIGADRDVPGIEALSWMPVAVRSGDTIHYYAFSPNTFLDHLFTREQFEQHKRWRRMEEVLDAMLAACREAGSQFVIVYGPNKPRVVMPLVRNELPPDDVRAFAALRAKEKDLPPAEEFVNRFFAGLDCKEDIVTDWCKKNEVPILSLTATLRSALHNGQQAFYTYDEHWTPLGHRIVAGEVSRFFADRMVPPSTGLAKAQ